MQGRPGEQIQPLHAPTPQQRRAAHANPQGHTAGTKSRRIEQRQPREPLRHRNRCSHADGTTPIVCHQGDIAQVQPLHQLPQIVDPLGQPIRIPADRRLVGQPAADMVGHDQPISAPQAEHQFPPIERPGGIAVHQQQRRAAPLVEIMVAQPAHADFVRLKGVQRPPDSEDSWQQYSKRNRNAEFGRRNCGGLTASRVFRIPNSLGIRLVHDPLPEITGAAVIFQHGLPLGGIVDLQLPGPLVHPIQKEAGRRWLIRGL